MKYGVVHNNFFYFYHPEKADGTKAKASYVKQIWVPLGNRDGKCIAFDTEEAAAAAAEGQFYNPNSWKVLPVEDDGTIIESLESEKLKLDYRPTKAEEGEKAE